MSLLQMEHHEIVAGISVGCGKSLSAYKTRNNSTSESGQNSAKVTDFSPKSITPVFL